MPVQYQLSFSLSCNKLTEKNSIIKLECELLRSKQEVIKFETEEENGNYEEIPFIKKFNIGHEWLDEDKLNVHLQVLKGLKIEILSSVPLKVIMENGKFEKKTTVGKLSIIREIVPSENENIIKMVIKLHKEKLDNHELHIYRGSDVGEVLVKKYEVTGPDIRIKMEKVEICLNDDRRHICLKLMKRKKKTKRPVLILPFTVFGIRDAKTKRIESSKNKEYFMEIERFIEQDMYTLEMFLSQGLIINCGIAIDFTVSNKDRRDPSSLHYRTDSQPTLYESMIKEIGSALTRYDVNRQYSAFGFGAYPNNTSSQVRHCFPLNPQMYCADIEGVLEAYSKALNRVIPSGPTLLEPVIYEYCRMVREMDNVAEYFIFVILTVGEITDVKEAINIMMKSTNLPLSIVIIGLGKGFGNKNSVLLEMQQKLKMDDKGLSRDIVTLVDFSDYEEVMKSDVALFKERFANDVFLNLADQIKDFMSNRRITPNRIKSKLNR